MTGINGKITSFFDPFKSISIAPLITFRLIFGALMFYQVARFLLKGWVYDLYIAPKFYFGYLGFEWVKPLPGNWMYVPFILMLISAIMVIVGWRYRIGAIILFVCFTYVELLDKSNYLNHYYFVSLMCFIMIWLPANRSFSLDVRRKPELALSNIAHWNVGILKFQLAVVYVFAGIAKLNSDWLFRAEPLKTWLQAHHNLPIFGSWMQSDWLPYVFSWTGCFYDLFIVFILLNNRLRPLGYFAVVFFHIVTWYLFPIGVFPWVMIFSTLIFFSINFHERILGRLGWRKKQGEEPILPVKRRFVTWAFGIYIFLQIVIPFRYVLYPGDLFWNEEGFRFSWRVMLMHKEGYATFYMRDPLTGRESEINNGDFLTRTQEDQMATQPDMILQYAKFLKSHFDGRTLHYGDHKFPIKNPSIHAEIFVTVNGRPSQLFVDKKHDLSLLPYNLKHRDWIEPFNP